MLTRLLFGKEENLTRKIYFWNLCAGLMISCQSAILLLVVKRAGGDFAGGVFVILYTVPQMLAALGAYSMRDFQVSDVREEYRFHDYYTTRVITNILMILACAVYGIYRGLSAERMIILLLLAGYRVTECMEDVYHGEIQKRGRLDAAALSVTIRVAFSTIVFCVIYGITTNMILASCGMTVTSLVIMLLCNHAMLSVYDDIKRGFAGGRIVRLLVVCFPLFLGAILYSYLVNAPKYSIDRILGENAQTLFNILFLPVFLTNAVCQPIVRPTVNQMGVWWNEGKTGRFIKAALQLGAVIIGINLAVIAGGYFFGCPILGIIYHADLAEYPMTLAVFLCFGGIAALASYLAIVLTIMRKQWFIIAGYMIGYLVSLAVTDRMVKAKEIPGAGYAYGIVMGAVFVTLLVLTVIGIILQTAKKEAEEPAE
ncbi:MAG: hypothetical protein J5643_07535 [Lachnospiraceae bacterium]|nr:hypothetical protein [Lachnospiraceae bacterium]